MELYLAIIKAFLNRTTWSLHSESIDKEYIRANFPEIQKIFHALVFLHENSVREEAGILDLELAFWTCYPKSEKEIFVPLMARIAGTEASPELVQGYLQSVSKRQIACKLGFALLDYAEGKIDDEAVEIAKKQYEELLVEAKEEEEHQFVSDDIEVLYERAYKEGGLRWRLGSLNRSLGPLRKGDFGFIFARPESGKTTFLASEVTYFAQQSDRNILWINNEEQGEKVAIRLYEASLMGTWERLIEDRPAARDEYIRRTGRRIKLEDNSGISRSEIEKLCKRYEPALIVVDQLDKVQGFAGDREDLLLGAIYQWARELAKEYAPVIGVSQADGSGEGIKYLTMGNVANAKTAKQAEADFILGIGFSYQDPPNVRGFSICKNKLLGGEESIPGMRHGKWEVLLQPEIARYADVK